jgi:hypothetical protein
MKKLLPVILLTCLATSAFSLDLSVGAGTTVGGFSQTAYYENYLFDSQKIVRTTIPFGFFAYVDATYGLVSVGFTMNGNTHTTNTMVDFFGTLINESDDEYSSGFLSFSLLGKFPFALGPVSMFPIAGIEYDLILYYHDDTGAALDTTNLDRFWFKVGVGSDIKIFKGLYVRPLALIGFKLLNADERQDVQDAEDAGATKARMTDVVFEGGVQVGWRF